ncbi:DUF6710 family protein [Burkholderia sp. AU16741]|uniref:DUF6710 family protein n=1 Tax=Burkholderia sp. AU16741 TaxID=2015347 RepID=UPI001181006C|nr:DUF6710 family protein [Burkholderia sp. AU16741]
MSGNLGDLKVVDPQTIGMSFLERWRFKILRQLRPRKRIKRKTSFENIIDMAHFVADKNPGALYDLVKLILRPIQAEAMLGVVENAEHEAPADIEGPTFFFTDNNFRTDELYERELSNEQFRIRLSTDVVLPWPWNRQRIANTLSSIGTGKAAGPWEQDFKNHCVLLWLPWGIAFVAGGNHSLTAGIVSGEGELVPEAVYDMSAMLDRVHCDGRHYHEVATGRKIAPVSNPRIAAVFEIGRLMMAHGVVPNRLRSQS